MVVVDESLNIEESAAIEHVVLPGESLSRIAEQYGLTMDALMEINGITDPNTIVIGMRLRLTPVINTEEAQPDVAHTRTHWQRQSYCLSQPYLYSGSGR